MLQNTTRISKAKQKAQKTQRELAKKNKEYNIIDILKRIQ